MYSRVHFNLIVKDKRDQVAKYMLLLSSKKKKKKKKIDGFCQEYLYLLTYKYIFYKDKFQIKVILLGNIIFSIKS